jgi:hypothetical protein
MLAGILSNITSPVYLPNPQIYELGTWAAEVADFFTEGPVDVAEERWRDWADYLSSTATGLQYGLPSSDGYDDWKDWAGRVYQVVM